MPGAEITTPSSVTARLSASVPISLMLTSFCEVDTPRDDERVDARLVFDTLAVDALVTRVAMFGVE